MSSYPQQLLTHKSHRYEPSQTIIPLNELPYKLITESAVISPNSDGIVPNMSNKD